MTLDALTWRKGNHCVFLFIYTCAAMVGHHYHNHLFMLPVKLVLLPVKVNLLQVKVEH